MGKSEMDCREFLTEFAALIEREYGTRCPDTASGCACCQAWALYDLVHTFFGHLDHPVLIIPQAQEAAD